MAVKTKIEDLLRGDLIAVDWLDICEDPVGNPADARLARRSSYGIFWERRIDEDVPVLITTTTLDETGPEMQGYCIYPEACVSRVRIIKKKRRKRAPKPDPGYSGRREREGEE